MQWSTSSNIPMRWKFNDEEFSKLNWRQRLGVDLKLLYRMRAQQLRNRYKYLIMAWSGGGDSTQALESFLKNDIPLDEIVIIWPVTRSQGKYRPTLDVSSTNMLSEWDFSIKPKLDKIRNSHPKLKITIADVFNEMSLKEDADDTVLIAEKHSFASIQRFRSLDSVISKRVEQHHDVATILGVGPTDVALYDNYLGVYFIDNATNPGSKSDYTLQGWPRNIEFFYWTPDFPEIPREQAHALMDHLKAFPGDISKLSRFKMTRNRAFEQVYFAESESYRRMYKSVIYPDYNPNTFQVVKPIDTHMFHTNYEWFHRDPHSKEFTDPWISAVKSHQSLISDRFFNIHDGRIVKYKAYVTKPYIIGEIPQTE